MTQTTHSDHVIHRDSHARLSRWPLGMFPSHYEAWPCKTFLGCTAVAPALPETPSRWTDASLHLVTPQFNLDFKNKPKISYTRSDYELRNNLCCSTDTRAMAINCPPTFESVIVTHCSIST
jgi:hypothetical protein